MTGIILVAGYATRLYPLTLTMPKALLEIGGKPIINGIVEQMCKLPDMDKIYVVTNHKFCVDFVNWQSFYGYDRNQVCIVNDGSTADAYRLGAIGDIEFVVNKFDINDSLMVIAGDNFFTYELKDVIEFHLKYGDCVCVKKEIDIDLLRQVGVCELDETGKIIGMEEKPQNPKSDMVAYATYVYMKDTLLFLKQYLQEGNIKDAPGHFVAWLSKRKDMYGYVFEGECYDIGTPEKYDEVWVKYTP